MGGQKMKKVLLVVLCLILAIAVVGCSGISAEDFAALQSENEGLKTDLDSKNSALDNMTSERDSLASKITELEVKVSEFEAVEKAKTEGGVADAANGVPIYDDEYVTISYLGCELDSWSGAKMIFYAINKTDNDLTFQADSLAIDGESLGFVSGSDTIAAQGKGKFGYSTKEDFPTMTPSTISGTLRVIDFEKTLFGGKQSYDVKFVNVEVA